MRFFYYYPTWDRPSGGNKQLRLQAALLRQFGIETFLLRDEAYFQNPARFDDDQLYSVPIPVASAPFERSQSLLHADDVLILPEVLLDRSLKRCTGWKVRIAVNNQNGFYAVQHGPTRRDCRRIEFAIANAPFVADLCRRTYGLSRSNIFLIPYWIDRPPFTRPTDPPPLAIGYMPRKLADMNRSVREAVAARHPDVPWVEIDGLPEVEVARRLQNCRIFFSAQDREGFGMPAIEAMACGTLVCGFAGTWPFPHPYATPENGLWAPDRDTEAAIAATLAAIAIAQESGPRYHAIRASASTTVARFTRATATEALQEMTAAIRTRRYDRPGPQPVLTWRQERGLMRLRYDHDRLGWPGRVISWLSAITKPLRRSSFPTPVD